MTTIQPTSPERSAELSGACMSQIELSPAAILSEIICAEPDFALLRETLRLYGEEIGSGGATAS